jgi:hypothetical protein
MASLRKVIPPKEATTITQAGAGVGIDSAPLSNSPKRITFPTETRVDRAIGSSYRPRMLRRSLPLAIALFSLPAAAGMRFIEDDYEAARAESKARKLQLFVEVWAPW